jgi:hypothetical protein
MVVSSLTSRRNSATSAGNRNCFAENRTFPAQFVPTDAPTGCASASVREVLGISRPAALAVAIRSASRRVGFEAYLMDRPRWSGLVLLHAHATNGK